jgi:hypothetical protein
VELEELVEVDDDCDELPPFSEYLFLDRFEPPDFDDELVFDLDPELD